MDGLNDTHRCTESHGTNTVFGQQNKMTTGCLHLSNYEKETFITLCNYGEARRKIWQGETVSTTFITTWMNNNKDNVCNIGSQRSRSLKRDGH